MIEITPTILLNNDELTFAFTCSSGPGGQNVNKVATAAQLRFNVKNSASLPEEVRLRLLSILSKKITSQGELIIKADRHRTQERNKQDALERLIELIKGATKIPKKRKKTKPTFSSTQRRLEKKKLHSKNKMLRSSINNY